MQPFPLTFPPLNASVSKPQSNIDFSPFLLQAGMTTLYFQNTYPYSENYFFSIERELAMNTVLGSSMPERRLTIYCWLVRAIRGIRRCAWR